MMGKNRGFITACKYSIFVFVALVALSGCGQKQKVTRAGQLFAAPPDIAVDLDSYELEDRRIYVYWSQTNSERGYALNARLESAPTLEFNNFIAAFESTLAPYTPTFHRLNRGASGYVEWVSIPKSDFDPKSKAFYEIGGNYKDQHGPLYMLYEEGKVNPDDLTVVVTDLEEQRLKNHILANTIREILAYSSNKYAAAIIAVKLPFRGTNYKPSPTNDAVEIPETFIEGETKPLYVIITGKKDAVAYFVDQYEKNANRRNGLDSKIVSTLYPGDINSSVKTSDVIIPERAVLANQTRVDKNKNVTRDLWNYRNNTDGVPLKIWNLQDQNANMVDYVGVLSESGELTRLKNEKLNLKLLQYKEIKGNAKNGHKLWQVNIAYNLAGYDASNLKPKIDNYRYLVDGVWQDHDVALLDKDLEYSETVFQVSDSDQAAVYVAPKNARGLLSSSSIIAFDVVLQSPLTIPDWTQDFHDDAGTTKGRTWNFNGFVASLLGVDDSKNQAIPELARTTVVLFDMPTQKTNKRK